MKLLLLIGIGGFIGSISRYLFSILFNRLFINEFPVGTLIINILGCFLIGLLINDNIINLSKYSFNEFLIIGVLGGFTTFSAFGMETYTLIKNELIGLAILYISLSIIFGLIAIYISSKFNGNI